MPGLGQGEGRRLRHLGSAEERGSLTWLHSLHAGAQESAGSEEEAWPWASTLHHHLLPAAPTWALTAKLEASRMVLTSLTESRAPLRETGGRKSFQSLGYLFHLRSPLITAQSPSGGF